MSITAANDDTAVPSAEIAGLELRKVIANIGAEVVGVRINEALDADTIRAIRSALTAAGDVPVGVGGTKSCAITGDASHYTAAAEGAAA